MVTSICDFPAFRFLFFLTIAGVFFYRSFRMPEWKWYIGLPIYWLTYYLCTSGSGMISAALVTCSRVNTSKD